MENRCAGSYGRWLGLAWLLADVCLPRVPEEGGKMGGEENKGKRFDAIGQKGQ